MGGGYYIGRRGLIVVNIKRNDNTTFWWNGRNKDGQAFIDPPNDWNPFRMPLTFMGRYNATNVVDTSHHVNGNGCLKLPRDKSPITDAIRLCSQVPLGEKDEFSCNITLAIPTDTFSDGNERGYIDFGLLANPRASAQILNITFGHPPAGLTGAKLWFWYYNKQGVATTLGDAQEIPFWDQYFFLTFHALGKSKNYDWKLYVNEKEIVVANKNPLNSYNSLYGLDIGAGCRGTSETQPRPVYLNNIHLSRTKDDVLFDKRGLDHYINPLVEPPAPIFNICFWWSCTGDPYTHRPRVAHYPTISNPEGGLDQFPPGEYPLYKTLNIDPLSDPLALVSGMTASLNVSQCPSTTVTNIPTPANNCRLGFWVQASSATCGASVGLQWMDTNLGTWGFWAEWHDNGQFTYGSVHGVTKAEHQPPINVPTYIEMENRTDPTGNNIILYQNGVLVSKALRSPELSGNVSHGIFFANSHPLRANAKFLLSNICVTNDPGLPLFNTIWHGMRLCNSVNVPR